MTDSDDRGYLQMMSLGLYEDFNASWNFQPSVFTGLNAFAENSYRLTYGIRVASGPSDV